MVTYSRKVTHSLVALVAALLFWGTAWAQAPTITISDANAPESQWSVKAEIPSKLCVGDVITFTFQGRIVKDSWHLYSAIPGSNAYQPTRMELFADESKGIKLKGATRDVKKPDVSFDDIMLDTMRVYHDKIVNFTQRFEITGKEIVLSGKLNAQCCSDLDGMCKYPNLYVKWKYTLNATNSAGCPTGDVAPGPDSTSQAGNDSLAPAGAFPPYDSSISLNANIAKLQRRLAGPGPEQLINGLSSFREPAEAMAYGAHVSRPVLLYFSALTDVASRKMEKDVLSVPAIDSMLRYRVVFGRFEVDDKTPAPAGLMLSNGTAATTLGAYYLDFQQSHFGQVNHPLFTLLDEKGQKFAESIGICDEARFMAWLRGAIAEYYTAKGKPEAAWLPVTKAAPAPGPKVEEEGGCGPMDLLLVFLKALAGGFVALLTPCVYPMIPMTVSFFVKQSEGDENRKKGMRNALTYALSIVFIYSVFGFLISAFLPPDTMYNLGSGVIPNLIFFVIFLAFGLSFFGLFEITLPSSWSTAMNNKAGAGGLLGPFFMALTLVIVSFSCTGPILGTAVVSASNASCPWSAFVAFLGFGIAFAIPFGGLALFPKLLERLPMAGGWMNTVKGVFGFVEIALCLKFLSNVDLSLHWHILDRNVFLAIWIVVFALLGAYFLGWIVLPHDEKPERVSVPRLMFAIFSFSFVMYLVPGLWGGPLNALEGLIPPTTKDVGVRLLPHQVEGMGSASGEKTINKEICEADRLYDFIASDRESHGLCMFYDLDQALEFAKAKNKPVFVDFTGHTCANCRRMEQEVWPEDKIMHLLQEEFVTVSLYADEHHSFDTPKLNAAGEKLRTVGDWVKDYQRTNYGLIAQPFYVLMDHDRTSLTTEKGVPFTPDVDTYEDFLKRGIAEFNRRHNVAPAAE